MSQAEKELLLTRLHARSGSPRLQSLHLLRWKENMWGYLFLLPSIIIFGLFLFYPMLQSVYLSLHLTNPRGKIAAFAGLDNFTELLTSARFYESLKVTGLFALYTVPTVVVWSLLLAALTNRNTKAMRLMQLVFSLPVALSVGTSSVIWSMMFHPSTGMFNYLLSLVSIDPVQWLTDPHWALPSISLMTVWMNAGFVYIVLLSGMKGIPADLYECARLDGAGALVTFWRITLPLVSPTIFFVSIVSVINALQSFGQIHILTKGGPMHTTDVVVYSIYQEAFTNFRFGTGSAQALVLFAIILVLTLLQFRFVERKVHYQ
ncbi:MAG: glycerol-3-phosphate transporter permease [Paenibacillaceae bacterium]|jgi:sn-glycerol 3-phosphate transport system permease protein|nr:glycerol-3-phosphate transporter permease [Paenibacillaceae bacterium]